MTTLKKDDSEYLPLTTQKTETQAHKATESALLTHNTMNKSQLDNHCIEVSTPQKLKLIHKMETQLMKQNINHLENLQVLDLDIYSARYNRRKANTIMSRQMIQQSKKMIERDQKLVMKDRLKQYIQE